MSPVAASRMLAVVGLPFDCVQAILVDSSIIAILALGSVGASWRRRTEIELRMAICRRILSRDQRAVSVFAMA